MPRRTQSCMVGALLVLAGFVPGCAEDNAKTAKIDATLPTDGLSTQQRREKTGAGMDPKAAGYTGPGSGGSGGNSRKR